MQSSLFAEEWRRNLVQARNILIKGADKGSSVVVCDRDDYLQESSRKLLDTNIYEDVKFNESVLTGLVEKSSKIFNRLFIRKLISEKELIFLLVVSKRLQI